MTGRSAFVGRVDQLDAVRAALTAADAGNPQFVLVTAPAGMGKTTLVDRALATVPHRVVRVLADELESSAGYAALGQLAAALSGSRSSAWPLLSAGVPEDASVLGVGAELVRLLGDLDPDRLLVLLVEDAQWLDVDTAAALQFAVRRLTVERAAVVVTTRFGIRSVDMGWQRPAEANGSGTSLDLGPLSNDDVAELALVHHGRRLAPAAAARLAEQTGGNPLHVRLIVESSSWEQLSAVTGPLPVSRTLAATVGAGFASLSGEAQALVAAAAVLGRPVELRLLQVMAGVDEAAHAITEASAAGLLRETGSAIGRSVQIPHPLIVTAVREVLDAGRREALERAAARFMTGETALRHRLAAAHGCDEELAAEAEAAAIAHEAAGDDDAGVTLFLAAAEVSSDPARRSARLLRAVGLMATQGDIVRALSCRADVMACAPSSERTAVLAALALLSGRLVPAGELLAQARRELLDAPDDRIDASVNLLDATRKVVTGQGGLQDAERVLAASSALPAWRQHARVLGALSHVIAGRYRDALAMVQIPPFPGRGVDSADIPLLTISGAIRLWTGDDFAAAADLEVVENHIRAGRRMPALLGLSLALTAEVHLLTGHWSESMAMVELALDVEEGESRALERPIVHAVAARVLAEHGEEQRAVEQLEAARLWSELLSSQSNRVYVEMTAATIALLAGDPAAAAAALDAVNRPQIHFRAAERRLQRALTFLAAGQPRRAAELAGEIVGHGGSVGAEASVVLAEAALARNDLPGADAALRVASTAISPDNAFLRAREAQVRGELAVRTGNSGAGIAAITAARGLLAGVGAWPRVARCDNRLAELQTATLAHGAGSRLSDRELQVARLVALGLSNSEAASRLFVSRKAIEFHLTNVYAKLGITSRRQLADRLQRGAGSSAFR